METDLICVVCNYISSDASELCKHHEALHYKRQLSQALLHLQVLLKQCKPVFQRFNQDESDEGKTLKEKQNKSKQHYFYNIMRIDDVNILFDNSTKFEGTDRHCNNYCTDDQSSYHDDINLVRMHLPI